MALPVLPPAFIRPVFDQLCTITPPILTGFTQYILSNWIEGHVFKSEDISVFGLQTRTNNDVEGYHNRINNKAKRRKYNIVYYI